MFKKLILALLIALPFGAFAQRFGTVDVDAVFKALPEYNQIQQQIGDASKKYEDEYANLTQEIQKKYNEFQELDKDASTPQSIKERRMQEIQDLDNKLQQFYATAQQDLARMQQQLQAPVEQKIMDAIKAVGQEGNYTFIAPAGIFYYQGTNVEDATPAVRAKLGI